MAHNLAAVCMDGTLHVIGGQLEGPNLSAERQLLAARMQLRRGVWHASVVARGRTNRGVRTGEGTVEGATASSTPPRLLFDARALRATNCVERRKWMLGRCQFDGRFSAVAWRGRLWLYARANLATRGGGRSIQVATADVATLSDWSNWSLLHIAGVRASEDANLYFLSVQVATDVGGGGGLIGLLPGVFNGTGGIWLTMSSDGRSWTRPILLVHSPFDGPHVLDQPVGVWPPLLGPFLGARRDSSRAASVQLLALRGVSYMDSVKGKAWAVRRELERSMLERGRVRRDQDPRPTRATNASDDPDAVASRIREAAVEAAWRRAPELVSLALSWPFTQRSTRSADGSTPRTTTIPGGGTGPASTLRAVLPSTDDAAWTVVRTPPLAGNCSRKRTWRLDYDGRWRKFAACWAVHLVAAAAQRDAERHTASNASEPHGRVKQGAHKPTRAKHAPRVTAIAATALPPAPRPALRPEPTPSPPPPLHPRAITPAVVLVVFINNPKAISWSKTGGDPRFAALLSLAMTLKRRGHTVLVAAAAGLSARPAEARRQIRGFEWLDASARRRHGAPRLAIAWSAYFDDPSTRRDPHVEAVLRDAAVPTLWYEHGMTRGAVTLDPRGFLSESFYVQSLNRRVQREYDEPRCAAHIARHLADDSSKRPQGPKGEVDLPGHVLNRSRGGDGYVFVPTQKFDDLSVRQHSRITYPQLLDAALSFCARHGLPLVIKVHPHLRGPAQSEQLRLIQALQRRYERVHRSQASINYLTSHALFTVTINGGTLMDNFYTQSPVLSLGGGFFAATDALLHAEEDAGKAMERMLVTELPWSEARKRRQRQVVCWYDRMSLKAGHSGEAHVRVVQRHVDALALATPLVL